MICIVFEHESELMSSEGRGVIIMILYHLYQGHDTLAGLRKYKVKSKSVSCITLLIFKHKCKHMTSKHMKIEEKPR